MVLEWFCSLQILNAIPSPLFSAAAELRLFAVDPLEECPLFKSDPTSFPKLCSIHPRRLTSSGSFKGRCEKAKSPMVASTIPTPLPIKGKNACQVFKCLDRKRQKVKNIETLNLMKTEKMFISNAKIKPLLFLLIFVPALISFAYAEESSNLWGQIVDKNKNSIPGIQIKVFSRESGFSKIIVSDELGFFRLIGLPAGFYSLRCEANGYHLFSQENISFEPWHTHYLKITLDPQEKKGISLTHPSLDYSSCIHQTIIEKSQIHDYPSAHNIWSLIENQDFSATTNRIDVGGFWSSIPALFSSRGGCSWTQNIYLLNGMDVTDPYWTGMPLFFPDFYSLRFTQFINAGHPPQALSPGAYYNLVTEEGYPDYHGGASVFYMGQSMKSSNITPSLEQEGIFESHSFNSSLDSHVHLSGPLIRNKLFFHTSWTAFHISRDVADYAEEDRASIYSGLVSLNYRATQNTLQFLWTRQIISHPTYGAGRNIPSSATTDKKNLYHVLQFIWNSRPSDSHFFKVGLSYNQGRIESRFQKDSIGQHGLEIFKNILFGPAPFAFEDERSSLNFLLRGESSVTNFLRASHRFQFGIQLQHSRSSSKQEVRDNLHLLFFEGQPLEIIKFNTPLHHRESAFHLNLFAQDSVTFTNFFSLYFGLHIAYSRGWIPAQEPSLTNFEWPDEFLRKESRISWLNLSPRLGLIFPLSKSKKSAFKISLARYYFTLPLNLLTYGNPNALGGEVYSWEDDNNDRMYQEGEARMLIRREGPFFSSIDPDLKRPYTDELTISFVHVFGAGWHLHLGGFFRETKNLFETINTGVPFSVYDPVEFFDSGDDRIPGTYDDLIFNIYNQRENTLGQDFFLLTNPDSARRSQYQGLDLILFKRYGSKFNFFLSLTATRAVGTTSPGNTEWENDDGLVGTLYDNPNTLINAEGRLRFDRAYTGRIGFNYLAPFKVRIGSVIKYYDGQPFARKIIVTGMNQGPFFIQAHPRGVSRYEFNLTVDIRIEKIFNWGKGRFRIILDGFNILNASQATEENEWTGPEYPLRFATEIQSPRIFRLGLAYEF